MPSRIRGCTTGFPGFDVETGEMGKTTSSFSSVFGEKLCELAEQDDRICAITAAMCDGTCLTKFKEKYKSRFFDVGIAEEHAVTFAGGLAAKGMLPVVAVYSTFLQRAFDELIHDVSLQNLKVLFAVDRAGIVGEDGKTHQGLFDTAFLQEIPNITLYSPSFFSELRLDLEYLANNGRGPCAVRYPRGKELYRPKEYRADTAPYQLFGASEARLGIVTFGRLFSFAYQAYEELSEKKVRLKLLKLNRIIPIDSGAAEALLSCEKIFFFEEGIERGGIGEHFLALLYRLGFRGEYILKSIKDPFIMHAPMFAALAELGLSADGMKRTILGEPGGKET